ncbi:MAG: hypothetical protein U1E45_14975 [Geminicoccaceae bacterium]
MELSLADQLYKIEHGRAAIAHWRSALDAIDFSVSQADLPRDLVSITPPEKNVDRMFDEWASDLSAILATDVRQMPQAQELAAARSRQAAVSARLQWLATIETLLTTKEAELMAAISE